MDNTLCWLYVFKMFLLSKSDVSVQFPFASSSFFISIDHHYLLLRIKAVIDDLRIDPYVTFEEPSLFQLKRPTHVVLKQCFSSSISISITINFSFSSSLLDELQQNFETWTWSYNESSDVTLQDAEGCCIATGNSFPLWSDKSNSCEQTHSCDLWIYVSCVQVQWT